MAGGYDKILEVLGQTPVSSEPGEGPLDDLAARGDDKAHHVPARFAICMRSNGTFATAAWTYQALRPQSAQISSSQGQRLRILWRISPAPSRSWIAAE